MAARRTGIARLVAIANGVLGKLAALMLFGMMALTFSDVIGRYVLNSPVHGAYELTEILLALVVFGAVPLATTRRVHVTTALFDDRMGPSTKRVRDISVAIFGAAVSAILAWRLWAQADAAALVGRRTPLLDVPIAPAIYFMAMMAALSVPLFIAALFGPDIAGSGSGQAREPAE